MNLQTVNIASSNVNLVTQVCLPKSFSLSSLNCENFKSNISYAQNLVSSSEFVYMNELWLSPAEKPLLESIIVNNSHSCLFNSDMTYAHTVGRPFGGQAWYIHNSFKVFDYKFVNKNISFVHLCKNNFHLILIGTYLPYDDNKSFSKSEYELNISILSSMIHNYKTLDIPIFIVGDFNADIFRQKTFDNIFLNFINDYELLSLNSLYCQKIGYTYKKKTNDKYNNKNIRDGYYHAHLDHILFVENSKIEISQCNILDDALNMSDHNAVRCIFKTENISANVTIEIENNKVSLDFTNQLIGDFYKSRIDLHSNNFFNEFFNSQLENNNIDHMYIRLCGVINEAYEDTKPLQLSINLNRDKTKAKQSNKDWFTPQLKEIKDNITHLNHQFKTEKVLNDIKFLKKNFRKIQRRNIYLNSCREHDTLERIANLKDKDKFWKFVKSKRKRVISKPKVNIPVNDLYEH